MSEYIAVKGLTLNHSSGSLVSGGSFTITSIESLKSKVASKGIYSGELLFTFTGGTHASGTSGSATGSGSIVVTSVKPKADGLLVFRLGDTGTLTGFYVPPGTPAPSPVKFTSSVEISDAGQNLVKGN